MYKSLRVGDDTPYPQNSNVRCGNLWNGTSLYEVDGAISGGRSGPKNFNTISTGLLLSTEERISLCLASSQCGDIGWTGDQTTTGAYDFDYGLAATYLSS